MEILTVWDIFVAPLYIILILLVSIGIQSRNINKDPLYKWYVKGIMAKCFGAVALCLIYTLYYDGGDTTLYFHSSRCISNVLSKDHFAFYEIMKGRWDWTIYTIFDDNTGWPINWRDPMAVFLARIFVPFCFLGFKTFIGTALLVTWMCYTGVWRLFLLFNKEFPNMEKQFAIAILFIPSVVFWGSGILKDTVTLSAIGWYTYCFYYAFIKGQNRIRNFMYIFVASTVLIGIKPYIFFAVLPGSIIWLANQQVVNVKSRVLRLMATPLLISTAVSLGFFILTLMGDYLGAYAVDNVLEKAVISNMDQKADHYGGNSFDIGDFEASATSMLAKAHLAIAATLFRPTLLDARNPVMFLSALENTYIMILTIFLLIRLKFWGFFSLIGERPLLLFSIIFSLFFAFSVGIATSNFGTLVRLKIPCIPFYVSSLFVLRQVYEQRTKKKLGV